MDDRLVTMQAGSLTDRPEKEMRSLTSVSNRSGILQVKNGFNLSVLHFIGEPTAAFWYTM